MTKEELKKHFEENGLKWDDVMEEVFIRCPEYVERLVEIMGEIGSDQLAQLGLPQIESR